MRRAALSLGLLVTGCAADGGGAPDGADASSGGVAEDGDASASTSRPSVTTDDPATSDPMGSSEGGGTTGSIEESSASGGSAVEVPPMGAAALLPWLQAGEYLDWTAESAVHASTGPHFGSVRTFVNGPLLDSLAATGDPHPIDAASVKELYGSGDEVLGWSVMVKVADGTGGDTWYWLEYYQGSTYADGVGASLCTGCHDAGTDNVLTPFPLQ